MTTMEIISQFLREQRRYTKNELANLFRLDEPSVEKFIRTLKAYNVLKTVKNNPYQKEMSDLSAADIEVANEGADNDTYFYVFTFVGVLVFGNRILKIFPKYLLHTKNTLSAMRQVLKVLEKYNNSTEQIINLFNGEGNSRSFNLLSVILFLFRDYYNYGIYTNTEIVLEVNGEGDIQWQKTIDETFPIISANRPFYTKIYTRKVASDEDDFFRRLHQIILTECSYRLLKAQLIDLFELDPLILSEETLDDLGSKEFILHRILMELDVQFNTRKQTLLKTMYSYIAESQKMENTGMGLSIFGTTSFNMVWEKVCSRVFNNQLQSQLGSIDLPKPLDQSRYNPSQKLIDVIEKPAWIAQDDEYSKYAKDTLIPDLITFVRNGREMMMVILDAKYYNLQMEKNKPLSGQPGIESVTKQYLYQLAYQDFVDRHNITGIRNCFILPTENDKVINKGHVEMKILKNLHLEDIQVRLVPAAQVYSSYLANKQMDIKTLELG